RANSRKIWAIEFSTYLLTRYYFFQAVRCPARRSPWLNFAGLVHVAQVVSDRRRCNTHCCRTHLDSFPRCRQRSFVSATDTATPSTNGKSFSGLPPTDLPLPRVREQGSCPSD